MNKGGNARILIYLRDIYQNTQYASVSEAHTGGDVGVERKLQQLVRVADGAACRALQRKHISQEDELFDEGHALVQGRRHAGAPAGSARV